MSVGAFMGGLADGFNTGTQMRDVWEKRKNKQYVQEQIQLAKKNAAKGASYTTPDEMEYRVPGLGTTADEGFAKSMAESQDFINGVPEASTRAGVGLDTVAPVKGVQTMALPGGGAVEVTALPGTEPGLTPAQNRRLDQEARLSGSRDVAQGPGTVSPYQDRTGWAEPITIQTQQTAAPAPVQRTQIEKRVAAPGQTLQLPDQDWSDVFYKKHVPDIAYRLMSQGRFDEAKAFEDMATNRQNTAFAKDYMEFMTRVESGDHKGAIPSLQRIFNRDVHNGQSVFVIPKGDQFDVRVVDDSGKLVDQRTVKADQITNLGMRMMTSGELFKYKKDQAAAAVERAQKDADWERQANLDQELAQIRSSGQGGKYLIKTVVDAKTNQPRLVAFDPVTLEPVKDLGRAPTTAMDSLSISLSNLGLAQSRENRADQEAEAKAKERRIEEEKDNVILRRYRYEDLVSMIDTSKKVRVLVDTATGNPASPRQREEYDKALNAAKARESVK